MSKPPRRRVRSGSPYEAHYGFSRAVKIGDRIVVSGTAPIWPDGTVDTDPAAQARRCFAIIADALGELGADLADVVRTRVFVTDAGLADQIGRVHGDVFAAAAPAATMVVVAGLLDERWVVEIEAEAILIEG
jgi:enamine deaminase RidA (YjgF/YER057c/UK114 family)